MEAEANSGGVGVRGSGLSTWQEQLAGGGRYLQNEERHVLLVCGKHGALPAATFVKVCSFQLQHWQRAHTSHAHALLLVTLIRQ